jgi:adenosine deaminase
MAQTQNDSDAAGKQSIDQLQERYQALQERKIKAEAQRDSAKERLEELKKEAREKYDTDDLEELKTKLEQMKAENEKKRAKYQADLDKIDEGLRAVEEEFAPQTATDDEEQG